MTYTTLQSISSGLAARALEEAIAQGKTIEIPSLGIKFTGTTEWSGEPVTADTLSLFVLIALCLLATLRSTRRGAVALVGIVWVWWVRGRE